VETVTGELAEYHRCTDAAREADHRALLSAVETVGAERPFAATVTEESVRAFGTLDGRLRRFVAETDEGGDGRTFVSRSHLLRAAREVVTAAAGDADPDWVVLVPRAPVDAAVLRTLVALAADRPVVVLAGPGGGQRLAERVAGVAGDVPTRHETGEVPDSEAGRRVLAAARNRPTTAPERVRTVAAPDRRREVARAVRLAGRESGRTLLVAPDPAVYRPALRDVSLTADRPYRVGTAQRVGTLPAARTLRATLTLVAAVAEESADGELSADTVVAPLRLGLVPPGVETATATGRASEPAASGESTAGAAWSGEWPLPLAAVERLRAALPETGSLAAHRDALARVESEHTPAVGAALDWAESAAERPPAAGADLRERLVGVVGAHARARRRQPARTVEGIAVETDRARAVAEHPAGAATRVRRAVERHVAPAYDRLADEPGWEPARTALRAALAAETRPPATDGDALALLSVADPAVGVAGVDHLVVLGLSAAGFPRAPPRPTLLHRAVREAVTRGVAGPAAVLDCETARYRRDLDALARALHGVRDGGRVTLVRPYKDDDGRDVAPSPFLDALSVPERRRERVALDEWVPDADAPATPKDRLRALARGADSRADTERLRALAAEVDPDDARRLLARVERFETRLSEREDG
jgi:hypothetical protein